MNDRIPLFRHRLASPSTFRAEDVVRAVQAEHAAGGALAVEMQAASLFAFAEARGVNLEVVAHVTNGVGHAGAPFDKGSDDHGWSIVQAMCRACVPFVRRT